MMILLSVFPTDGTDESAHRRTKTDKFVTVQSERHQGLQVTSVLYGKHINNT